MTTTVEKAKTYDMYVDGKWVSASGGKTYDIINPATEEVIGHAPDASREDMQRAIAAANKALYEGPWPKMTKADRGRIIRQIADGLEKRKEDIRALLVAEAAASGEFVFIVSDTGIGIAAEDIPRAMAPFGQVDTRLSRKFEGTGLGLPLAKSLTELHGGEFLLVSRIGVGTTVTVRLPATRIVVE
ncbi:MAG: aldehyde dehydrogenase family protein [Proteobacteria bacterium]|nr:aldehyde dehydrogenase family protein [Pseudomonadota bacterium]